MHKILLQFDVMQTKKDSCCCRCLAPMKEWLDIDERGCAEVAIETDQFGNMVAYVCPNCAEEE